MIDLKRLRRPGGRTPIAYIPTIRRTHEKETRRRIAALLARESKARCKAKAKASRHGRTR